MTTKQKPNILSSLAQGLKLKHADLATLVETASQQARPYDFFRTLATYIIPFIQKSNAHRTLVNRWNRETRVAKKRLHDLKEKAVHEVTEAYNKVAKRLEDSQLLTSIQGLKKSLDEAKGYLNGTQPVYLPSHFEMAADSLASVCRLLIENRKENLVSDFVEIVYFTDKPETPRIAKCYFYNSINKVIKENQKWGWNSFDRPHVCWSYLWLVERCWNLESKDFEGSHLKSETIEDCKHSGELLGLHSYWVQIQGIRNKQQGDNRFFTIERFSKYLEVICNEILIQKSGKEKESFSAGIYALSLTIHEDDLLLLVETDGGRTKTPYLLHKYSVESAPYLFMKELISHPDNDWAPSDVKMQSGSSSHLLDRAKITGTLRSLFIKKGKRKGSIQLISEKIMLRNLKLSTQLAIKTQLDDLNLIVYNPEGIGLPKKTDLEKLQNK